MRIKKLDPIHFPKLDEASWKILLYHMTVHNGLQETQIQQIFDDQDWVHATLKELEKTALIYKKSNKVYAIHNSARHYVEEWLKELKVLD
ncbi:MAG TPA: hypothetical protein ENJ53_01135 [Phaeodactylibacter sp.]|nr:hypothetical protein [Phaeodactylibacter sp.]